jgi:uncharacterized alkaline shock family protein YloU
LSRFERFILIFFSLLLSIIGVILLPGLVNDEIYGDLNTALVYIVRDSVYRWIFLFAIIAILGLAVWAVSFAILSGRLSRTRIRQTDIGTVDIGVDAIESIALNSAKSAQVGIKSAKAHVFSGKEDAIRVQMNTVLYANVEVPAMMSKVQERVKKDIERYTGIPVETVSVKVSRVEPVVAKVER